MIYICGWILFTLHALYRTQLDMPGDKPATSGNTATGTGERDWDVKQEPMDEQCQDSPISERRRADKRKLHEEVSGQESMLQESSNASTLLYEVPADRASSAHAANTIDKQLALFLGLRGIDTVRVRTAGLELYFSEYGYGSPAERAEILPQLEAELGQCSMLKVVQFFRHFLEPDVFESFASTLYTWIQDAQPDGVAGPSVLQSEQHRAEDSISYLDSDKLHLLRAFRRFLEDVAQSSCTVFERKLRTEFLEKTVWEAEAEQVAGCFYDALLPEEAEAWNRRLHEEGLDAYWMPV